mmetsp:Transcript_7127/g.24767  ORF Transcript_7127/g.24767 Transcript_7127/m.24767 type:complete len:92 (-) Transcript_7127:118-393(-)
MRIGTLVNFDIPETEHNPRCCVLKLSQGQEFTLTAANMQFYRLLAFSCFAAFGTYQMAVAVFTLYSPLLIYHEGITTAAVCLELVFTQDTR